jgi:hypothetical protein
MNAMCASRTFRSRTHGTRACFLTPPLEHLHYRRHARQSRGNTVLIDDPAATSPTHRPDPGGPPDDQPLRPPAPPRHRVAEPT